MINGIILVRSQSNRLKNKCYLKFGKYNFIEHIIKRLAKKGFIHLDEYYSLKFPGAKIATDTVLKKNKIKLRFYKRNSHEFKRYYLLNE